QLHPSPVPVYVAFAGTLSVSTVVPDCAPGLVTVIVYTTTSPAFTCVCAFAAWPLTDVTCFDVLSCGLVGFDGLHELHVPTDDVTTLPTVGVLAGSGLTTVSV